MIEASRPERSVAVLIPAWCPTRALVTLVEELDAAGVPAIIVVDDGSGQPSVEIFAEVAARGVAHVVRHAINLGKGRALKTGMNEFLTRYSEYAGLATADADGQHRASDILRAIDTFATAETGSFVLGVRRFDRGVPFRSRFGNAVTSAIFRLLTGKRVSDTQTGLRVFSRESIAELIALEGERYEYEMSVLSHLCRTRDPIEVGIATIYLDKNASSHFHPVRDSARIYFVLLRFYSSSIFASVLDTIVFAIAFLFTANVSVSFVVGRSSSLVNYALNRRFVFRNDAPVAGSLARYLLLVIAIAVAGFSAITTLTDRFHWNVVVAKILVETALSLFSFAAQRTFVFATRSASPGRRS